MAIISEVSVSMEECIASCESLSLVKKAREASEVGSGLIVAWVEAVRAFALSHGGAKRLEDSLEDEVRLVLFVSNFVENDLSHVWKFDHRKARSDLFCSSAILSRMTSVTFGSLIIGRNPSVSSILQMAVYCATISSTLAARLAAEVQPWIFLSRFITEPT